MTEEPFFISINFQFSSESAELSMIETLSDETIVVDLGGGLHPKKEANISVDLKRNANADGTSFIEHDLNNLPLPFEDNSVDKFILDNVLEHLDVSATQLLGDTRRCLKTYGLVSIVVPNTLFLSYRLEYLFGIIPKDFVLEHKKHFTFRTMEYAIKNAGLKIDTIKNWKSFVPLRNVIRNKIEFTAYKLPG